MSEEPGKNNDRLSRFHARCYDLRPGTVDIRAETILASDRSRDFQALGFSGEAATYGGQILQMTNKREISRWRIGQIQVSKGEKKDPIEAEVKYLDRATER